MTSFHTPINVAFVNYHDFTSNSAIHIFHLANGLVDRGLNCAVCIPGDAATVGAIGRPKFQVVEFADAQRGRIKFDDGSSPTLIHAWTPREVVRKLTEKLAARDGWPYVVHLEDHEDAITAETLGLSLEELAAMPAGDLDAHIGPNLTHPTRGQAFLSQSAGVTVILDRLLEIVPAHVQSEVIWPAFEEDLFQPQEADRNLRHTLGLRPEERVVVYAGNAHAANVGEIRSLYLALHIINRRGYPTRLIRLGRDFVDVLGTELGALEQFVVHVGFRPRPELPKYFALADILVQPGGRARSTTTGSPPSSQSSSQWVDPSPCPPRILAAPWTTARTASFFTKGMQSISPTRWNESSRIHRLPSSLKRWPGICRAALQLGGERPSLTRVLRPRHAATDGP